MTEILHQILNPQKRAHSNDDEIQEDYNQAEKIQEPIKQEVKEEKAKPLEAEGAHLIEPYKTIGIMCDNVPFIFHKNEKESLITVSIHHAFQRVECEHMRIIYQSEEIKEQICCIAVKGDFTFVGCKGDGGIGALYGFKRVHKYFILDEKHDSAFVSILIGGDYIYALDANGFIAEFELGGATKAAQYTKISSNVRCIMHMPTYINKVIAYGGKDIILFNVKTKSIIYAFPEICKHVDAEITSMVESPVVDVAAISLINGKIIIANIKTEQIINIISINEPVSSISFSTDTTLWTSMLLIATNKGNLLLWDLNKNSLLFKKELSHKTASITKACFLPKEPIIISSSGNDNSIKKWIVENTHIRMLCERTGHSSYPTYIRFYNDLNILSSSNDCILREQNLYKQGICHSYSNKGVDQLSLGTQFSSFSLNLFREGFWANILAVVSRHSKPLLLNYSRKAASNIEAQVTCKHEVSFATISQCGNYGFLGYSNGQIDKFNMQSGNLRGTMHRHTSDVTSIMCDSINVDIISTSTDQKIILWDFSTGKCIQVISTNSPVLKAVSSNERSVFAIADQLFNIKIYNSKTREEIRKLGKHINNITDLCFSKNGRRLFSSAMDGTIMIWDIIYGVLIEWIKFDQPPLSIDISPSDDLLATSHIGVKGIHLWVYRGPEILVSKAPTAPYNISLKYKFNNSDNICLTKSRKDYYEDKRIEEQQNECISENICIENKNNAITSTDLPLTKWIELTSLEEALERNKPIVKKTEAPVPFFLFNLNEELEETKEEDISHNTSVFKIKKTSQLPELLKEFVESENNEESTNKITDYLKSLPAKILDSEIHELSPFYNMGSLVMVLFKLDSNICGLLKFSNQIQKGISNYTMLFKLIP